MSDLHFDPPFEAFFLDFDGVILDSVPIKSVAFREVVAERWPSFADAAHEYFMRHGGVPRRTKFEHVLSRLIQEECSEEILDTMCDRVTELVFHRVMTCPPMRGAMAFLKRCQGRARCFVLSGTPEEELRKIVEGRGLSGLFEGVFGSPRDKVEIGRAILQSQAIEPARCAFVGDATTDRDAAQALGMTFFGIHGPHLTPFANGSEVMIDDLSDLIDRWER